MRTRQWRAGLLAVPLLLAGCAGADATTQPAGTPAPPAAASDKAPTDTAPTDTAPTDTAAMICGPDITGDVGRVLSLPAPPPTTSTWADRLYTCDYQLPMGALVLSVEQSPSRPDAARFFDGKRAQLGDTAPAAGLGERAFATPTGTVVVIKDAMTLTVDATALPPVFGDNGQRRNDFAYEVASVVLGCWTGHE